MTHQRAQPGGYIILTVIVMAVVLSWLGAIGAQILINNARFTKFEERQSKALNVAEAGVNYYLWHLAHNPTDYRDGNSTPTSAPYGPYVHNYYDNDGNLIGTFTLTITPPPNGSTITTVQSVGQVPNLAGTRTILAQLGQPSFANYALLAGTEVWFGSTETSLGPVMSNVGVHFDGVNNGTVTSGQATYKTNGNFGAPANSTHAGVWGNGGPQSQWQFPVPTIPFSSVTANVTNLTSLAQSGGVYLAASGAKGYYLSLKTDGSIDIYKVTNETSGGITKTFVRNQAAPTNGVLVAADDVWVDGAQYPGRLTIVAARLPSSSATWASIKVINNLTYKVKDGSAAIGLIAQQDVQVADYAPSTLEIDGATLAQNGHVYVASSAPLKTSITYYGSIASYDFWTWNWVPCNGCAVNAGYNTTATQFDSHLIYAPPPQYPTTGNYSILNWREQLYNP